ncbi:MAG: hypothetical protein M9962_02775 [Oligoflexia bacterium]|nr:hypothetical protein [Oligoflexia bacterium]
MKIEQKIPVNIHYLLVNEACPADLFIFFRGQYAPLRKAQEALEPKIIEKILLTKSPFFYVNPSDWPQWKKWIDARYKKNTSSSSDTASKKNTEEDSLFGNKRAEFLSYARKTLHPRDSSSSRTEQQMDHALNAIEKVIRTPLLDWYFNQFHEPPDLFQHNARVTFGVATFCLINSIKTDYALEELIHSCIIHELEGDPKETSKKVASQTTLQIMEKKKYSVPKKVLDLIKIQDELYSGKGSPKNLKGEDVPYAIRIFSLFNLFDHYRVNTSGTRRSRFDRVKKSMESRKDDFDPVLWTLFWSYWEEQVEGIS